MWWCGLFQGNGTGGENKPKVWEKQKKGKKKGGKAKKKVKQAYQWKAAAQARIDKENAAAAAAVSLHWSDQWNCDCVMILKGWSS